MFSKPEESKESACTSPGDSNDEQPSQEWKPQKQEWLIFGCLALLAFVISLDTTIITPAIPVLETSLDGNAVEAFWAGTSYLLASAVCQPLIVDLSDIFGRRSLLMIVVLLFTLGTILCAVSSSFGLFLTGRSLQGVGGGGIMAGCLVITTDIVPLRKRPTYYSIVQMAWAIGTLIGPLIGGAIAQNITWRWIFYINLPFCGIGIILVPLTVRLNAKRPSIGERLASVDWIGGFLFISSFCAFLIGITWGGNQFQWSSWRTFIPIIVGFLGIISALTWETFGAKRPFIPMSLFSSLSSDISYICACLQGALITKSFDAIQSGLALMVILGLLLPSSIICGVVLTRTGHYRWAIWSGWALVTLAIGLMALMNQYMPARHWAFIFVTLGIGNGLVLTSLNFAIQALATNSRDGTAAGMYTFCRSLGMCIGVAVAGTFFQNRLRDHLTSRNLPGSVANSAPEFALRLQQPGWDPVEKQSYILAFTSSFKDLWLFFMAVAALALLLSLFIQHATLDRNLDSDHTIKGRSPGSEDGVNKNHSEG
ncbi:major facilitator superfamily domain-containing protein [Penicillium taxi]|uniref:major facilitator superfamily domain-containing protein n=1 Tax=Penicillium taxi TaxID=168475 RepID=UPI002544D6B8|nr:major facilitator superfamily domain-containing protein [Penicillium taxi]KAJ5894607.1 major facilitator superfamily domain-containing protein [Penicillium taxi]